jgi:hypothetical protein
MKRGEESLVLEIARRRAAGDPERLAVIKEPPGPTDDRTFWLAAGAAAVFVVGLVKLLANRRRV